MKNGFINYNRVKSLIKVFYRFIMPAITIILLLIISPIVPRHSFLGLYWDIGIRFFLCVWFCLWYIALVSPRRSWIYPRKSYTKAVIRPVEKVYYIGRGIALGIVISIFTWWVIITFLPVFSKYIYIPVILNGLIFMLPSVIQYEGFKL